MTRIIFHVEGQTEEEFVKEALATHLYDTGFTSVSARIVGNSRLRKRRGGICAWSTVRQEIYRHLSNDIEAYASKIVDFYALPATGPNGWPGRATCGGLNVEDKANHICEMIVEDLAHHHGREIANRFIPYIAMHEFEGLLFSDPIAMARGMALEGMGPQFQRIRDAFPTPEHINDSPMTAPSKRIIKLVPGYQKVLYGNLAAIEVTLQRMREECPVFRGWLQKIEALQ